MNRAPSSTGPPRGPALRAVLLLAVVLLMVTVKTDTQELPEPLVDMNKIIMMLKVNMEEMKNQISSMHTSLMEIKEEFQTIKKFNNMPGTGEEYFRNISCPEFFIPVNTTGECFLIGNSRLTYKAASDRCKSIGAYLAIPKDLKSLGPFLDRRESGPTPQYLWIGINDQLIPNVWRWIDGMPVDASILLYNWNGLNRLNQTYSIDNPTKPGYNCGVLSENYRSNPLEYNLESRRCDLVENSYLCEIDPASVPIDIDVSLALCAEGFSAIQTTECIYISTSEESTSYLEAEKVCSSLGAKLAEPWDVSLLSAHLHKQSLIGDPGFWLHIRYLGAYPYVFESWNDTAPDILKVDKSSDHYMDYTFWLSKGYCPLLRAGAIPYDWDNGEVDDCSSNHRFICTIIQRP